MLRTILDKKRKITSLALIIAVIIIGICVILFITAQWGIGMSSDSVFYYAGAQNLQNGHGITVLFNEEGTIPLTLWPWMNKIIRWRRRLTRQVRSLPWSTKRTSRISRSEIRPFRSRRCFKCWKKDRETQPAEAGLKRLCRYFLSMEDHHDQIIIFGCLRFENQCGSHGRHRR